MKTTVRQIINNWDPIGLLSNAPDDEYDSEIDAITRMAVCCKNCIELAEGIYQVFVQSFGEDVFCKTVSECEIIADEIFERLKPDNDNIDKTLWDYLGR